MNTVIWRTRSFILVAGFTLFRLFMMGRTGLGDSESYYWAWSRHLDLSYFDHPPMVAWLIRISTAIGGDTAFWTRLPSAVLFAGVCWLMYKTAMALFKDEEAAFWGLLIFNLSPLFSFGALQMVPDIPAAFFWMLFVYLVQRTLDENRPRLWYAAGAVIGAGLLSKYMLLPLIPSTLLMLAWHEKYRHHLKQPHIYLGGVLGLVIFSPVLAWNYIHDFPSFKFHLVERNYEEHFSLQHMGEFLGGQALYMSPLVWFGLLYVVWRAGKELFGEKNGRFTAVFWLSAPPLVFFYYIGLWSKDSEPHWAAFGYLLPILAWGWFFARNRQTWKKYTAASLGLSGLMIGLVYIHSFVPILPIKPKYDIINELYGWDTVGKAIDEEFAALPDRAGKFIMAHHWVMCSQMDFSTQHRHPVFCANTKTDEFDFFPQTVPLAGADFIFVADNRFEEPPETFYRFERAEKPREIQIVRGGIPVRKFYLYRVYGYEGQNLK
ncbi:MAG: glycosyltransferase family 39 protein [Nitrospinae bacterium]|nr:glycosyltransferase family 39 protein [Nitrospinota bacterium]